MIDYGLVEAYIEDVTQQHIPRLGAKRRVVDASLTEYTGVIAEIEGPTFAPGWDFDLRESAPFRLIYLENEDEHAIALWRDDAKTAFEGEPGERRTVRFDDRERMLMYPGRSLP